MKIFNKLLEKFDLITEGGTQGHLAHPIDIDTFTFADLKDLIDDVLSGRIDYAEEKVDAINLAFSVKNGEVIAARNKSHIKNFGKNALDISGIASKFSGRNIGTAYADAMTDIQNAVNKLPSKSVDELFNNGQKWMSMEVMSPESAENIIKYGITELKLHGTLTYDIDGNQTGSLDKKDADYFDNILRKFNQNKQKVYTIQKSTSVKIPQTQELLGKKQNYFAELSKLMSSYKVTPNHTIRDAKELYFRNVVMKNLVGSSDIFDQLINRWVDGVKNPNIKQILNNVESIQSIKQIQDIDNNLTKIYRDFIEPLDILFLRMGVDVLRTIGEIAAVNPDEAVRKLKSDLLSITDKVNSSNVESIKADLDRNWKRLNAIGGVNAILPIEGIVFYYKDHLIKLTGAFAPLNMIMGIRFKMEHELKEEKIKNFKEFYESKSQDVQLFLGRMQPPTGGHLKVITEVLKNPVVALVKGKLSSSNKDQNPFPAEIQLKLIKKYTKLDDSRIQIVNSGFLPDIIKQFSELDYNVVEVFAGSERIDGYKKQLKYADTDLSHIKFSELPRFEGISGTQVRQSLKDNDFDTFKKAMPKILWQEFESLRQYIK